ncbi:hypothetical protein M6D81_10990 [Paenibacillus sp. J5C_2022]|uniref:hypothetical protein n=1 Tax=Paenibacillus sp. J5C2022 TaxID=2977129 RepID=UPI0021CE2141|nr:hypothetical protein [Paenibacillus sp. J5C2022]MCU6709230.1 hypothetical protein [Paenibacillus sp. J5C2022]
MKKFTAGLLAGIGICAATTAMAAAVNEYILTKASYPIYVDGSKYAEDKWPVLNYEGNTYVPLAKFGDLTGLDYAWNEELHRVEIFTEPPQFYNDYNGVVPNFAHVANIDHGKRVSMSDRKSVYYVYDATDATDAAIEQYIEVLKKQGYSYNKEKSDEDIDYYSKGGISVGLTMLGYDFNVVITSE